MIAMNERLTCLRLDWLLGFAPVCGPYPKAKGDEHDARRRALRIVPALGFACCRVVDTQSCIRTGSTPSGSANPKGP